MKKITSHRRTILATFGALLCTTVLFMGCEEAELARAEQLALEYAGVDISDAQIVKCESDYENGREVYEVEFVKDGVKYEYVIDAETEEIIEAEVEQKGNTPVDDSAQMISLERAKEIALEHAGLAENAVTFEKSELDREDGRTVYEIDFTDGSFEYDYEIEAYTGAVVGYDREKEEVRPSRPEVNPPAEVTPPAEDVPPAEVVPTVTPEASEIPTAPEASEIPTTPETPTAPELIGTESAKEIALSHAGRTAEAVIFEKSELDIERGPKVYEIEFKSNGFEYDYEIDAVSGNVIKSEKEVDDDFRPSAPEVNPPAEVVPPAVPETPTAPELIGTESAKEIALSHAGLTAEAVIFEKSELDIERGVKVYEIEFKSNGFEYDYEIDAVNGNVIKSEKEVDDDFRPSTPEVNPPAEEVTPPAEETVPTAEITAAQAKEIALSHAGASASEVRGFEIEKDIEKGRAVYEIEFSLGRVEYEYEIDALTGKVTKFDKEIDD